MKKLLLLLLIVGCEEDITEPKDCAGTWGGNAAIDCAGICNGESLCAEVEDIDGNLYKTIFIGNQNWMIENLKVTHYNNGNEIETGYSATEWSEISIGAYTAYNDDPLNSEIYGKLYNWYAVESEQLCMDGWHVPTDDDFLELELYLGMVLNEDFNLGYRGGNEYIGVKLAGNESLWVESAPITSLDNLFNLSKFNAIPGGKYFFDTNRSIFFGLSENSYFWTSSEYQGAFGENYSLYRTLDYENSGVMRNISKQITGMSVRCVQD